MTDEEPDFETISVLPQLDADGTPYVLIRWGPQQASFSTDDARAAGLMILETAADAELQAIMARWLLTEEGATRQTVAQIILAFRRFRGDVVRTIEDAGEEPAPAPEGDPNEATA